MGNDFDLRGWMRLPFRFNAPELKMLSELNPHRGRGERLVDMHSLAEALPIKFTSCLQNMGFDPRPNRAVGFAKSKDSNWSLPWHQDRIMAMNQRIDSPDYSNWARKSGVWHCEPSVATLQHMTFAYIAFDNISDGQGGLELAEGTHRHGKIAETDIAAHISNSTLVKPELLCGEVLLISSLTLHRSAVMRESGNRRTLRIDFSKL